MSLRIGFDCDGVLADLDTALEALVTQLFGPLPPAPARDQPRAATASSAGTTTSATPNTTAKPDGRPAGGKSQRKQSRQGTAVTTGQAPPTATANQTTPQVPPPSSAEDQEATDEEVQVEPQRFHVLTRQQQHALWDKIRHMENFWETLPEMQSGAVARLAALAAERRWEVIFITQRPSSGGDTTQRQTQRWLARHGFELPAVFVIKGSRGKVAEALSLDVVVDDRPENCLDVKTDSRARSILIWNGESQVLPANARRMGIDVVPTIGACLDLLGAVPPEKPGLLTRLKKMVGVGR